MSSKEINTKYYKVLTEDGRSCHGGKLKWSLPKNGKSGKWHHIKGEIKICFRGLHLTTDPSKWTFENCSIYEAEPMSVLKKENDKIVTRSARLIRKLSNVECVKFGIINGKFNKTIYLDEKFCNNIYINDANANIVFGENFSCYGSIEILGSKLSIINLSNSNILITAENSNIMFHGNNAYRFNEIYSNNCEITSIGKNYIYAYKRSVIKAFTQTNVVIDSSFDGKIYLNIPKSKITSRYFDLKRKDLPFTIVNI